MTDKSLNEFARIASRYLDEHGHEKISSESLIHNTGLQRPPTLQEQIKRMIYSEKEMARHMGNDVEDDDNDFDDEDDYDMLTPYEMDGYEHPPETPSEPPVVSKTPKGKKEEETVEDPINVSPDAPSPTLPDKADSAT